MIRPKVSEPGTAAHRWISLSRVWAMARALTKARVTVAIASGLGWMIEDWPGQWMITVGGMSVGSASTIVMASVVVIWPEARTGNFGHGDLASFR
jgi:hypothetical protein